MNTFHYLPEEEDKSLEITTEKRYRNCKKTLAQKKERYETKPSHELKEKIDILQSAVNEWEISKMPVEKKSKKKKKMNTKDEDEKLLDRTIKMNKKILNSMYVKKKQIDRLWNKPRYTCFPLWKYKDNLIFPQELIKLIICLFMMNRRDDNYFGVIPKDVLIDMLEKNICWYDYSEPNTDLYEETSKRKSYSNSVLKKRNKRKKRR